jgi:DnaJ-class molecular chaperone
MPYCPKCRNFYYVGSVTCSTCGESLAEQAVKTGGTVGQFIAARKKEAERQCPYCRSSGKVKAPVGRDSTVTCPVCNGRRYNLIPEDWLRCKRCEGTGEYNYSTVRKPCLVCKGTGWLAI